MFLVQEIFKVSIYYKQNMYIVSLVSLTFTFLEKNK